MNTKILYLSIILAFIIGLSLTTAQGISPFTEIGNLEMETLAAINDIIVELTKQTERIDSLNATEISEQAEQDGMQTDIATLQLDLIAAIADTTALQNRINFIEPLHVSSQAPELVSCWTGDGDATDSIGSNNGTIIDTVLFPTGQVGQAFDTTNGYILVPDSDDLNMKNGITLAVWINPQGLVSKSSIIQKWDDTNLIRSDFRISSQTGPIPNTNNLGSLIRTISTASSSLAIIDNNSWTHIALSYDGVDGIIKYYKNGDLIDEDIFREDIKMSNSTGTDLLIGNDEDGFFEPFNGFIDEVAIFNHALTDQQISDVFVAGASCSDYAGL